MHGTWSQRDRMARARGKSLGVLVPRPVASPPFSSTSNYKLSVELRAMWLDEI